LKFLIIYLNRRKKCQKEKTKNFLKKVVSQEKENLILTKKRRCNPTNIALTQLMAYKNIICTNQY